MNTIEYSEVKFNSDKSEMLYAAQKRIESKINAAINNELRELQKAGLIKSTNLIAGSVAAYAQKIIQEELLK